jgi:hypothetical protein
MFEIKVAYLNQSVIYSILVQRAVKNKRDEVQI